MKCDNRCWPPGAKCGWDCYVVNAYNLHLLLEEQEKRKKEEQIKSEPPRNVVPYLVAMLVGWYIGEAFVILFREEVTQWVSQLVRVVSRLTA